MIDSGTMCDMHNASEEDSCDESTRVVVYLYHHCSVGVGFEHDRACQV